MEERLQELRAEYEQGLQHMARVDEKRRDVQRTLLRISGAIQVLEELLAEEQGETTEAREQGHVRPVAAGAGAR